MIRFHKTCDACPEQYDAYKGTEYVGYLRLRHGRFTVEDVSGNLLYSATPKGDGCFDSDERDHYLSIAAKHLERLGGKATSKYVVTDNYNFSKN